MQEVILKVNNLKKAYGKKTVLNDVSLEIIKGDRIAIIGPNGCGKTTFCETIAGILNYQSGQIVKTDSLIIGMQLQGNIAPKNIKVWDFIKYYLDVYNIDWSNEVLEKEFQKFAITDVIDKDVSKLSGGQQQKVNIFLSILNNPDLLILDELATGLDIEIVDTIYENLDRFLLDKEKTLLLISHNMEEIQNFSDKILFMNGGEITSINNTVDVIKEYGSVKDFVKEKFKEYSIENYENNNIGGLQNAKWAKDRKNK
ncbi:ABC transporter ATP-binding protein [Spiroplasma sabaudiense Ar-1343]|uniref:ABC transporter ATP-binding protein n=1 Tax=Spiroplasma sabaudiense Ar-1343 TaxID=1276257 RepID=W6AIS9_9MOLU|nr:ABC transporter ATP-binding protein [Spiroplasma sabaudiense]AHI53614.1 ABC transporter ATP-binding protein [Spiroplasma sabaudiense Ar-1343]